MTLTFAEDRISSSFREIWRSGTYDGSASKAVGISGIIERHRGRLQPKLLEKVAILNRVEGAAILREDPQGGEV